MIDFQDAYTTILSHFPKKIGERVSLISANGRKLLESFYATKDFPPPIIALLWMELRLLP